MEIETLAGVTVVREERSPAAWVKGMAVLPFGLALGFMATALPFLLTRQGVPLGRVAEVSATALSPTIWAFLLKPLLDSGLRRSTYCLILALTAAIGLGVGITTLTPAHMNIAVPALLITTLSMVLYTGSSNGWTSFVTGPHERGAVGGWQNVANLGGGALGSFVVMGLLTHGWMTQTSIGWLMGGLVCLGASPLLLFPKPPPPQFRINQVLTKTLAYVGRAVRRRECVVGFALLLLPAAGSATTNLIAGMGKDFQTSESTVIWVTGIWSAVAMSIGALLGGRLSDRFPKGYVYLLSGFGTAITALLTAVLPHTELAFVLSTLVYALATGSIYGSYQALGLELTGTSPVASTQLGLFAAAINVNLNYMTRFDGLGYKRGGATGLFLVDGLAGLVCIVPLLFLVRAELRRSAQPTPLVAETT